MDKDASQLVEFPRFEEESTQSGVTTFLNKLWKLPLFSPSETSENLEAKALTDGDQSSSRAEDESKQEYDDKPEIGGETVEFEGRSLQNVLRRISSLVALGSGGGTRYADTELARYWMPDDISRECYECATRFSALRRRHHCRVCGQIFCSRCCSQRVPGHIFGCNGGLRVCNYCCNIVLRYLKENDATGDMSTDLKTLQENLQTKFPDNKTQQAKSGDNFVFAREQDERCERTSPKEALQDVFKQLSFSLPTQQHRYRLVRYNGVWRGCDILQWVTDNTNNKTRAQASAVCERLLNAGYMECCTELQRFADYALYRPTALPDRPATADDTPEEHPRMVESVSSYCLDLNLDESSARLIKSPKMETKSSEDDQPVLEQHEGQPEQKHICKAIEESGEDHLKLLMRQCLARQSLAAAWLDVLYPLCQQAAEIINPDIYSNDIDVRNYVQVKKVPGDTMKDSCVIQGVVMTKNVAHRGMPQQISNPTVLLLDCSIAYQRVEGKLTSLEPLLLQEQEYLVRCGLRVCALSPRVVCVRGRCARAVQDELRARGLALADLVRHRAMHRVARCARAEVVTSIDARIGTPRLGTCRNFYVKNYPTKTLMVLEGCAEPQLGCCILLRGASLPELVRVKKVVKFMLLACYNWKLEKSFLGDIEAILPEPGMTFDDDSEVFNDKNNDKDINNTDVLNECENVTDATRNNETDYSNSNEVLKPDDKILKISKEVTETTENDKDNVNSIDNNTNINESANNEDTDNDERKSEIDDPLQKSKTFARKTDSDKNPSCGVPIRDFSDPLRALGDDEVFMPKVDEARLKADDDRGDRWSTDDTVLSMSPNVVVPAPYLDPEGRRRGRRAHCPAPPAPPAPAPADTHYVTYKAVHPFISKPITTTVDDPGVRASLANYRATGCRIINNNHIPGCPLYKPSVIKTIPKEPPVEPGEKEDQAPLDPLSPENHQRLSMLLYSYSAKSANVPDFCVNPWIATMEMYGKHDISLGAFLEKYCFNGDYKCSSANCSVPMNEHVRRFVHGDVCLTITCNTVGHSNVDKIKEEQSKQVWAWSRCERCGLASRTVRVRARSLRLSLAAYARLRCAAPRYVRARACSHPLHTHAHALLCRHTTAWFRYSKIQFYDIKLPTEVISTKYDTKQMRDALLSQLNELMPKGHETFAGVSDPEAEKEYQSFKQHMENIHLELTSSHLQEQTSVAAVVRSLWSVSDKIIFGEKMLRDAQDKWSSPVKPVKPQVETNAEEKTDLEDSTGDAANNDSSGTEEDEERGDKKTVRQILTQLLSNNQPSNQNGMIISTGVIPVVVMAGEIGSVIAATLASVTYQKTLIAHRQSIQTEQEESESTGSTGKDKSDGEKPRSSRSNDHIEVLLKDGLVCRVYYAVQFQKLRHMLIATLDSNPHITDSFARPSAAQAAKCCDDGADKDSKVVCDVEEGFLRSLAHCVPWAARGGKSGSTFCKTKDDRYVLKEMTKPEWQQFLEFAPHYFNYVTTCHQNKTPSLLARIVGVYGVGGAGAGVLVLENVWYSCPGATRYDLKGSSRHRLAPVTPDNMANAVLMDENLLNLRWEKQLYIQSHVGSVLWSSIERDTQFLAHHGVMDYSLLLGIDGDTLVLGIIDYIRTFTWDKKLEHLVKKNLGSGQPTVLSPQDYRRRFTAAARKYFLQAPHHWDHLYTTTLK